MKLLAVSLLGWVMLLACTSLSPQGEKVRATQNPVATTGCQFLGRVVVVNKSGFRDSEKAIQNEAAKLGADLVYFTPTMTAGISKYYGKAYRCSPAGKERR